MVFRTRNLARSAWCLALVLLPAGCILPSYDLAQDEGTGGRSVATGGVPASGGQGGAPQTGGSGGVVETGGSGGVVEIGGSGGVTQELGTDLYWGEGHFVDGEQNAAGINGHFFVIQDSETLDGPADDGLAHSTFVPAQFDETAEKVCFSGTLPAVTNSSGGPCNPMVAGDCAWDSQWGAGIGLNLNEMDDGVVPFDASDIQGFTFKVSGSISGATLRFRVTDNAGFGDVCTPVLVGTNTVRLIDLEHGCWLGGVPTHTLDRTQVMFIDWQLVTTAGLSREITDFCVESLSYF